MLATGVMFAAAAAARRTAASFVDAGSGETGAASAEPGDPAFPPSVCDPNCRLMASCAAISSCCLARTSAVDVPAIQPSLHPTRFLSPVLAAAARNARFARTSILASRTAWMGSSASLARTPDPNGSTSSSYASSSSSTWILRGESDATGSSNASSSSSSSRLSSSRSILRRSLATRNLSTSSSNGTVGPDRGAPTDACVVGLPVPLGFVNASGARVGWNPNRRARSVAFFVRLAASDFCVLVIGLLALAKGTSARGLCCVGGSPSRLADPEVSASWDKGVGRPVGSAGLAGDEFVDGFVGTDSNVRSSDARVC